jgi:hypothetical protein
MTLLAERSPGVMIKALATASQPGRAFAGLSLPAWPARGARPLWSRTVSGPDRSSDSMLASQLPNEGRTGRTPVGHTLCVVRRHRSPPTAGRQPPHAQFGHSPVAVLAARPAASAPTSETKRPSRTFSRPVALSPCPRAALLQHWASDRMARAYRRCSTARVIGPWPRDLRRRSRYRGLDRSACWWRLTDDERLASPSAQSRAAEAFSAGSSRYSTCPAASALAACTESARSRSCFVVSS